MKVCFKCSLNKPLDDFYKHSGMSDGHLGKCKICTRIDSENRRKLLVITDPHWVENEAERQRKKEKDRYYKLKGSKELIERTARGRDTWEKKYPYKRQASRAAVNLPVSEGLQRHHWSYNKEHWLDIIPIKPDNHYFIHRFMNFDPETRKYKTLGNRLLETKEQHLEYISKFINA